MRKPRKSRLSLVRKLNIVTELALDMCGAYGAETDEMRAKVRVIQKELKALIYSTPNLV